MIKCENCGNEMDDGDILVILPKGLHFPKSDKTVGYLCSIKCAKEFDVRLKISNYKFKDIYENCEAYLSERITELIYLPTREFIRRINTEGKTHHLGTQINLFKLEIEAIINILRKHSHYW